MSLFSFTSSHGLLIRRIADAREVLGLLRKHRSGGAQHQGTVFSISFERFLCARAVPFNASFWLRSEVPAMPEVGPVYPQQPTFERRSPLSP
jgi:hypothetical protein